MLNKNLYTFNRLYLFILLSILYVLINWLTNNYIYIDSFFYSAFGNDIVNERIKDIIILNKKMQWIIYFSIPLFFLLKLSVLAGIIYIGCFLFDKTVSFNNCFKIMLVAEFSMLLSVLLKVLWFIINEPSSIQEIQFFYPISLIQLFTPQQIPEYLIYPLQQVNVFEIVYWLLIIFGIMSFTQKDFLYAIKVTAFSYGISIFVWIVFIVFFKLQFS